MESISVFDIFKIGVGPSSSHTLGPWNAARDFAALISGDSVDRIEIHLYGSLSKTGKGHATDIAVQLGLLDLDPVTVATEKIPEMVGEIKQKEQLKIGGRIIPFRPGRDIIFHRVEQRGHPNTLVFRAYQLGASNEDVELSEAAREALLVRKETYRSIGGGFIHRVGKRQKTRTQPLPFPVERASELLEYCREEKASISDIVLRNEAAFRTEEETERRLDQLVQTMFECVYMGCTTGGYLPGGLNVKRRAKALSDELLAGAHPENQQEWMDTIQDGYRDFRRISKWVSCFALAVNEQNAALGRVVTAPTNGAAGVIPAVLLYYYFFCEESSRAGIQQFICTAAEIGSLFKKGATISAAVGGCQAEIGVSSAMAAAGLTEVLGGSPQQVLMAAEIAMEHHLGLTCDPVGGLVQIPCIERNAMGAAKAITATNLALSSDPDDSRVHFDVVVETMWQTAKSMNKKYKETSEGGLAYQLPVIIPEC